MKKVLCIIFIYSLIIAQDGKIDGVVHYNYSQDFTEDATNENTGFALTRAYLTYKKNLSDKLSYKFQADMQNKGEAYYMYIKNAKIDWKLSFGKLIIGLQGMNIFNIAEKTWGFRFLEKSPMDYHKFSSSADLGIGYSGKLKNFNYSLLITNGSGYKKTENDKYKKISTQLVYGEKKLVKNDGYNFGIVYSMETYDVDIESEITNDRILKGVFFGFAKNGVRIGGEVDMIARPETDIIDADEGGNISTEWNSQIQAVYASYRLFNKLEGLLYYDMYDPNTDISNDATDYIIIGINYYPTKGLIISPNIRLSNPEKSNETLPDNGSTTHAMINFKFKF